MKLKAILPIGLLVLISLAASGGAVYEYIRAASLESRLAQADTKNNSLQSDLSQAKATINELQNQRYEANSAEIALLQKQVTQANTSIANLQSQLFEANAKIASLQRIPNVSEKQTITRDFMIIQNADTKTLVADFKAERPGYIFITGYSSTTLGFVLVNDTRYAVSTGYSLQVPVVAGQLSVYFGNTNFMNSITGSVTVEFWY